MTNLKKSDFPEMLGIRPIVVDADGVIIGGNMRFEACRAAGLVEVPVIHACALTEAQKREFIIKDNVSGGEWDFDKLANEWDLELLDDWGLDLPVLTAAEDVVEDDFDVPDGGSETNIVLGDLFEIGGHRLLCGDSTNPTSVEALTTNISVDVIVFDPPYDVETLYSDAMPTKEPSKKLIVMWDFKRFGIAPFCAIKSGWVPQYEFIWDCCQSWYTPNRPLARHKAAGVFCDDPFFNTELSIIFDGKDRGAARIVKNTRGNCKYNPLDGAKHISTVEQFPNTQQTDDHGHGKPLKWISAIFAGVGGSVFFDMLGGSGATMVACHQLKKRCLTMELNPKYCQSIIDRMMKLDASLVIKRNGEIYGR